jgi:hypothetical protein
MVIEINSLLSRSPTVSKLSTIFYLFRERNSAAIWGELDRERRHYFLIPTSYRLSVDIFRLDITLKKLSEVVGFGWKIGIWGKKRK